MGDDNDDNEDDDDDHEFTSPREKFVFNEIMKEVIPVHSKSLGYFVLISETG
jgi:hypothetical protein